MTLSYSCDAFFIHFFLIWLYSSSNVYKDIRLIYSKKLRMNNRHVAGDEFKRLSNNYDRTFAENS